LFCAPSLPAMDATGLVRANADASIHSVQVQLGVSKMRWYCLFICSSVAAMQGGYWNNFGPITEAVKPFFGWQNSDIALLANWGPIMFLLFAIPFTWVMDVKGVKWSCVISAFLLFAGSVCRVVHVEGDQAGAYLMHAGQILNAIPGPVAMGIGPVLSAAWFPPHERTTATAICAVTNYGGNAGVFLFGPMIVKPAVNGGDVGPELFWYMMGELVLAAVLLVGAVLMPSKPPFPPSASAQVTRTMMTAGFRKLVKSRPFWILAISYGMICGFLGGWSAMLGANMQNVLPDSEAQDIAGMMGFWGAFASIIGGTLMGLAADKIGRKKPLILSACAVATLMYLTFACLCSRIFGGTGTSGVFIAGLYATSITAALLSNAVIPLFFEMAVEAAYPVAEGLTINILTVISNIASMIFLFLPALITSTQWMNWACAGALFLPIVLMAPMVEKQVRMTFDQEHPNGSFIDK